GVVHPGFQPLSALAVQSLAWVSIGCLIAYIAGYQKHSRRALESIEMKIDGPGRWRTSLVAWLHRSALQHPLQRATFHFIGQTFTRSSKHRLFLAAYGGFAIAFAILILFPVVTVDGVPRIQVSASGLVAFPLILSFCLLTAFRAAFSFPAELSPNWVFQVADAEAFAEHLAASRKWVTLVGVLPLFAALAPWAFFVWPWNLALFYLSFG